MNVSFISLGCDKNRVNTEQMMALCLQAGITVQEDCPGSDVVVINTCGFIDSAKSEAIDTILSAAQLKDAGEIQKILVTGCLSQRYQADILDELPEIDGIMGTGCFGDIVPALEQVMNGQECRHFADINGPVEELPRVLSTPRQYAYLRIAEGCSNRCAYCVIPSLRGNYRSRRMEDILQEAQALADDGVQECIVIAQDITRYGMDLYGERKLPELLRALCRLPFHWIRLHYLYPDNLSDELIDTIAGEEKICNYLDIPIQHCNDTVLKAMRRRETKAGLEALFADLRRRIPGVVLRTSLITGLPYEDEAAFEELPGGGDPGGENAQPGGRRRGPAPGGAGDGGPGPGHGPVQRQPHGRHRGGAVRRLGRPVHELCGPQLCREPRHRRQHLLHIRQPRGGGGLCPCAHHRRHGRRAYR